MKSCKHSLRPAKEYRKLARIADSVAAALLVYIGRDDLRVQFERNSRTTIFFSLKPRVGRMARTVATSVCTVTAQT